MKRHFTKFFSLVLALFMLLPMMIVPAAAAFNHQPYWALQAAYTNALNSGNADAILKACEGIINFYKDFADADATYRVETPVLKAAKIYEERGAYEDALRMYKIYKECMLARKRLTNEDVRERLLFADAFIDAYAFIEPAVYVHANKPADMPYYGAKNEPETGTYVGMCENIGDDYDESLNNGSLLFVQFESESISSFNWCLPKTSSYYMLEVAWNIQEQYNYSGAIEYFNKIANGSLDSYIIENMKYLANLKNCGVLLRFGAEVNCWEVNTVYYNSGQLDAFKKAYIAAFRHVHDLAEMYATKVAMVYSPNDISNMYVTHEDFYPGDAYVDWVGFSCYGNNFGYVSGQFGNMVDAFYKRGMYENQMVRAMEIVSTYGDRKPILVSECGFMYKSTTSVQTEKQAQARMEYFYTYVNMLFPQVKAVFYFNTNFRDSYYRLFGFGEKEDNNYLASVYAKAIHANAVIDDTLKGVESGYSKLETLNEKRDDLTLSVYAAYPGNPTITVTYELDGKNVATTSTAPYTANLSERQLTEGRHTLKVTTKVKNSVYTEDFIIYVDSKGVIRTEKPDMKDVASSSWSYPYVSYCMQEGFFDGLVSDKFEGTQQVSRAMFVTLLGRAAGIDPTEYAAPDFWDVDKNAYYAPYITWAQQTGITAGTGVGVFSPNMILDRAQICTMLVRYCRNVGISLPIASSDLFADDAKIASWYKEGVYTAKAAGIVSGVGNNMFNPAGKLTREQIATILTRFHKDFIRANADK